MKWARLIACAVLLGAVSTPTQAKWNLVESGKQTKVAKGGLQVTPGQRWNCQTGRPIKNSEIWTLDGVGLNELYFVSGLEPGMTLFRDLSKKENPLPTFQAGAGLTEIPEFYESSVRVQLQTSLFETKSVEPTKFADRPGIKFQFEYGVKDSPLIRKGVAVGTLIDGKLHMIVFVAPALHYFDRDLPKAERIIASAKI